jgi:4-amino-4-deoxy-L-arabinose transferase-like glycosyltransferase
MAVGTLVGVVGLVEVRRLEDWRGAIPWARLAAGVGLSSVLIGPACWSLAVVLAPGNGMMPAAEPSSVTGRRDAGGLPPGPPPGMDDQGGEKLVDFLRANRRGERIFVAAPSAMEAAQIITRTGEPAVSLGGFLGADPVLTKDDFARLVEDGEVRFVLFGGGPGGGPPGGGRPFPPGGPGGPGNAELLTWVREHGEVVDAKLWRPDEPDEDSGPAGPGGGPGLAPGGMFRRMRRMARLYDCRPERGPLTPPPAPL